MVSNKNQSQLAIDGGNPIRKTWLPYGKQSLDQTDKEAVLKVLGSDFITRGPVIKQFEAELAEFAEMPYAVAFSSATAGLHAAMAMYGVGPGKKVAIPAITFAATANAVLYCQGEIDFCDLESRTLNIDPNQVKEDHDVVVSVDFAGNPCRYEEIKKRLRKGAKLVADAAHSMGATYGSAASGSLADCSVFSFHPVKSMTTGEGGAVLVRTEDEVRFLRQFRSHGIDGEERPGYSPQNRLGFNYHITEIQAALGVSQLKKLPKFLKKRKEIAAHYLEAFKNLDLFDLPEETPGATSSWHLFPIQLRLEKLTVGRDQILKALRAENIGVQVHYLPVYQHPYYQSLGFRAGACPVAEAAYLREISLPIFPDMTEHDIRDVKNALDKVLAAYRAN